MSVPVTTPTLSVQSFFSTTLSSSIISTDTVIPVNAVPTGTEGFLVIDGDNSSREIIYYTSKGASSVTCPSAAAGRAQGGTTAGSHSSGATVKMNFVDQHWSELQNGNALGLSSITPEKLLTGTGTSWPWASYTPAWTAAGTAPAIGNGSLTGAYKQVGKTVHFRIKWVAGSTTTFGTSNWRFSLPVTPVSAVTTPGAGGIGATMVGTWYGENPNILGYAGGLRLITTGTIEMMYTSSTAGAQSAVTVSTPTAWANTWYIMLSGTYEAA